MSDVTTTEKPTKKVEKFPKAYTAFLPLLNQLSEPMKSLLRGHLLSLESILHSLQRRDHNLIGDFEGVGGLTQRGEMSRILQSELLLRTEAPLEFLRRIAEGEALYMETEHSDPGEKIVYRIVFSFGPNMLGHGRLVALACLIFLARIAATQNAELHWCLLPQTKLHWFSELSVASLKHLLKYGSYTDASPDDIKVARDLWDSAFSEGRPRDTLFQDWFIGPQNEASPADDTDIPNSLTLALDPPQDGPRTARLDLKRNGLSIRRLPLTFPEDVICVSALNRPFNPIKKVKSTESGGVSLPPRSGWEPRYIVSLSSHSLVVRFENFPRGLLFLNTKPGAAFKKKHFLQLPPDVQLAGIHFSSDPSTVHILVQKTTDKSESLILNSINLDTESNIGKPQVKEITSAHLFTKQPSHALPILHVLYPNRGVMAFTSLGQPFEFLTDVERNPQVNILYKERRILFADGTYKVLQFDPKGKSTIERQDDGGGFEGPSLHVVRKRARGAAAYPIEASLTHDRIRGIAYSRSSRGLAFSLFPGQWRILERNSGAEFHDFSETSVMIAPYEIILRSHMTREGLKLVIYSDATRGGDGVLRNIYYNGDRITHRDTLYKFGKLADNLTDLTMHGDETFWGVILDREGDPKTIVTLTKEKNVYKKTVLHMEDVLSLAKDLDPVKVFG